MCCLIAIVQFALPGWTDEPPSAVSRVTASVCADCHSGNKAAGGFDLERLTFDLSDPDASRLWTKAFDVVNRGEMPPPDTYGNLDAADRSAFCDSLSDALRQHDRTRQNTSGRGLVRRLNRSEFESTLSDLFQMPLDIQESLPEDARGHGFDTVGEALNLSSVQMESYLEALDSVLDKATRLIDRPKIRTRRLSYLEEPGTMQTYPRSNPVQIQKDGVAFLATEHVSHLNAVLAHYTVPYTARYRVTVSAYAIRSDDPVVLTVRAGGTGHQESNHVRSQDLGHYAVTTGQPQTFTFDGWLERGHYFHCYPSSLRPMRFVNDLDFKKRNNYTGPGVVVQWVEVKGPFFDSWPPPSHKRLWQDTRTKTIPNAQPDRTNFRLDQPPSHIAKPRLTKRKADSETGNRLIYDASQKVGGEPIYHGERIPEPLVATLTLNPLKPKQQADRLLSSFVPAAFRRPVARNEITPFIKLAHQWLDNGETFESAMRTAYKAVLVSPAFLYHQGTWPTDDKYLSQHALAERLAFFLWNGPPDKELLERAGDGRLASAVEIDGQIDRMLSNPRSNRFVEHFLDQWLDLRLIDFTSPDSELYPEHNRILDWSMLQETRGFFRHLIDKNLPASNLIDSDFAMLNWRLAKHYKLPAVAGMNVRPVALPEDSVRGGLMTQASILKVTANGTTTSPVIRGAWVLDRIIGTPPEPPPPGIPAIEPDIRGATTVREQLAAHRAAESCAACHKKIDPPGVALESFDVTGAFRTNYRRLDPKTAGQKVAFNPAPLPVKWMAGPEVDPADELHGRGSFKNIEDFKTLLLQDKQAIARTMVEKLTVYATGAPVSFADREIVDAIVHDAKQSNYGVRSLIRGLIQSELFRRK